MLDEVLLQGGGKRHTPSVALFHTPALRGLLKRWACPQRGIGPLRLSPPTALKAVLSTQAAFAGLIQEASRPCMPGARASRL